MLPQEPFELIAGPKIDRVSLNKRLASLFQSGGRGAGVEQLSSRLAGLCEGYGRVGGKDGARAVRPSQPRFPLGGANPQHKPRTGCVKHAPPASRWEGDCSHRRIGQRSAVLRRLGHLVPFRCPDQISTSHCGMVVAYNQ